MNKNRVTFFDDIKDPAFRKQLVQNPHDTLEKAGLGVGENVNVKIVTNAANEINVVMPPQSSNHEILEHELEKIAAGEAIISIALGAFAAGAAAAFVLSATGVALAVGLGALTTNDTGG